MTKRKARVPFSRTNHLTQEFAQGPYPALRVADFPPELVELVEEQGSRFDERAITAYERAKAFLGFQPVILEGAIEGRAVVVEPTRSTSRPTSHHGFSPDDLGD